MNRVHEVMTDLRDWAASPGLPVKELAREIGVAPNTFFKLRRGPGDLKVATLEKLENARLARVGRRAA